MFHPIASEDLQSRGDLDPATAALIHPLDFTRPEGEVVAVTQAAAADGLASPTSINQRLMTKPTNNAKRKRKPAGTPDPGAEVVALSPTSLMESEKYVCDICNQGFQREQNLQMHRRRHKVPWKLGGGGSSMAAARRAAAPGDERRLSLAAAGSDRRLAMVEPGEDGGIEIEVMPERDQRPAATAAVAGARKVYVCPEPSCLHHNPAHALGDLVGIKKHYRRKHSRVRQWECDKCGKAYAVQSDFKAHVKTCGTRGHCCDCGRVFSRVESFIEHQDSCGAAAYASISKTEQGQTIKAAEQRKSGVLMVDSVAEREIGHKKKNSHYQLRPSSSSIARESIVVDVDAAEMEKRRAWQSFMLQQQVPAVTSPPSPSPIAAADSIAAIAAIGRRSPLSAAMASMDVVDKANNSNRIRNQSDCSSSCIIATSPQFASATHRHGSLTQLLLPAASKDTIAVMPDLHLSQVAASRDSGGGVGGVTVGGVNVANFRAAGMSSTMQLMSSSCNSGSSTATFAARKLGEFDDQTALCRTVIMSPGAGGAGGAGHGGGDDRTAARMWVDAEGERRRRHEQPPPPLLELSIGRPYVYGGCVGEAAAGAAAERNSGEDGGAERWMAAIEQMRSEAEAAAQTAAFAWEAAQRERLVAEAALRAAEVYAATGVREEEGTCCPSCGRRDVTCPSVAGRDDVSGFF